MRGVLKSEIKANGGYVTSGACKVNTELLRRGMETLGDAVRAVHDEIKDHRATAVELKLGLEKHLSEQNGMEKAETSQTTAKTLAQREKESKRKERTDKRNTYLRAGGLVLVVASALITLGLWFGSKIETLAQVVAATNGG